MYSFLFLERLTSWISKHMDKHDRPYKCKVLGCEKLQGFTYSGGLLRHEREVHKLHGGTKTLARCPFPNCKRSSGAGFTRKENLHEHIRRVHRGSTDGSEVLSGDGKRDFEAMETEALLQGGEVDTSPIEDDVPDNIDPSISSPKRRRIAPASNGAVVSNGTSTTSADRSIAEQLKRLQDTLTLVMKETQSLRIENQEMNKRMTHLEEALLGDSVNGV
jgi:hypothetical protein